MNVLIRKMVVVALVMAGVSVPVANAEYLGLVNGRSANPNHQTELSVELGLVTGDLGDSDYQYIGARVNYRVSPELVLIGDVGTSEFGSADGTPFGLGILYFLSNQRISNQLDIAVKVSYNAGEFELNNNKGDVSNMSFQTLLSGATPTANSGISWYANFGVHRLEVDVSDSDSSVEFGFGGGLTLPTRSGLAYAGFDYIDEMTFGLGFRFYVQ